MEILDKLSFDDNGLIPAITQDETGRVLMLAYMNREAVKKTLETGLCHYYSRSRKTQWLKGETSGHVQKVKEVFYDCDADTLLIKVEQVGGACHTGHYSCFYTKVDSEGSVVSDSASAKAFDVKEVYSAAVIQELFNVIKSRKADLPEGSYTAALFKDGPEKIRAKLTEEVGEIVEESEKEAEKGRIVHEAADILYHLLVLLAQHGVDPGDVFGELKSRRKR